MHVPLFYTVRGTQHEHEHILISVYIALTENNNDAVQKLPIWCQYYVWAEKYNKYIRKYQHTC